MKELSLTQRQTLNKLGLKAKPKDSSIAGSYEEYRQADDDVIDAIEAVHTLLSNFFKEARARSKRLAERLAALDKRAKDIRTHALVKKKCAPDALQVATRDFIALQADVRKFEQECQDVSDSYKINKDSVENAIDSLRSHPERGLIKPEILHVEGMFLEAANSASDGNIDGAFEAFNKIKSSCLKATSFVDALMRSRDSLNSLTKFVDDQTILTTYRNTIDKIRKSLENAHPLRHDCSNAYHKMAAAHTNLAEEIYKKYINPEITKLKTITNEVKKSERLKEFLSDDIISCEKARETVDFILSKGNIDQALLANKNLLSPLLVTLQSALDRLRSYEIKRAEADQAIANLDSRRSIIGKRAEALTARLADADKLAARNSMKIEEGTAIAVAVKKDALKLLELAKSAALYIYNRKIVVDSLKKLDKDKQSIDQSNSGALVPYMTHARQLLLSLPPENATLDTHETTTEDWKEYQFKLGKVFDAVSCADYIAVFIKGGYTGDDIIKTAEHKVREGLSEPVRQEVKKLAPDVEGHAAMQSLLVGVTASLDEVKTAPDWKVALEKVGKAEELLQSAKNTIEEFKRFRDMIDKGADKLATFKDRTTKKFADAISGTMSSIELVDALDFTAAQKTWDKTASLIDELRVSDFLNAGIKPDGQFDDAVRDLLKHQGGEKTLDALVRRCRDDAQLPLVGRIAKVRLGIDLVVDGNPKAPGEPLRTGKALYKLLTTIPDAKHNPSLVKVERLGPEKTGGSYSDSRKRAIIRGRPDAHVKEKFGEALVKKGELPTLDEGCATTREEAGSFNISTLHEVGHAVDDRLGFMDRNGSKKEHGGWTTYGDIGPIAWAVAKHYHYDEKQAQRAYVRDLILGKIPPPPVDDDFVSQNYRKKVVEWHKTATNKKVWWSQTQCDNITIDGTIYHEAYDGIWVSYRAEARKQGVSGYQFRAPGEWFAELYAAYHNKMLGNHPAVEWLKKL